MSDSPIDLDLRLLPDWLKEPAGKNPYANYEGETRERSSRRPYSGGHRPPARGRPRDRDNGPGQGQGPAHRNSNRQDRQGGTGGSARHGGSAGSSRDAHRPSRGDKGPPRGPKNTNPRGPKREGERGGEARPRHEEGRRDSQQPQELLIPFQVDFLPEPVALAALLQQIKGSNRAYPLYGLGRMFLNKPERHRVRLASNAPSHPLYQLGDDGPLYLNRAQAERDAFHHARNDFYREESREVDPPKGNFTNIARCRISGVLLGPTNHHGYQLALRRLYEARFSRRMDFAEFQRQIEVVTAPEIVEEWKKEASTLTLFHTTQEEEAKEFKTVQEVEAHFRENYVSRVVREAQSIEISGEASRKLNERRLRDAVREAWEKERGFPAQIVGQIRPHLGKEGLHVWKHRKRILFISTQRPSRFDASGANVSENVRAILEAVEAAPKCTRNDLSLQLLKPLEDGCDEAAQAAHAALKTALAADLHWLLQAGHVIEFHDGTLDLPLAPKPPETATTAPAEQTSPKEPEASAENVTTAEGAEIPAQEAPASSSEPTSVASEAAVAIALSEPAPPEEPAPSEAPSEIVEAPPEQEDAAETPVSTHNEQPLEGIEAPSNSIGSTDVAPEIPAAETTDSPTTEEEAPETGEAGTPA